MDEIRIGEKTYISSKRAAAITGYAKDYVGQLCREGHVEARMVGRSWYVFEPSIRAHRFGDEAIEEDDSVESVEERQETPQNTELPSTTWERPSYTAEEVIEIPEIQDAPKGSVNLLETGAYGKRPEIAPLNDMQRAWEEWFDMKRERGDAPTARHGVQEIVEEAVSAEDDEDFEDNDQTDNDTYESPEAEIELVEASGNVFHEEVEEEEVVAVPIRRVMSVAPPSRSVGQAYDVQPVRTVHTATAPERAVEEAFIVEERVVSKNTQRNKRTKSGSVVLRAVLISIALVAIAVGLVGSGIAAPYLKTVQIGNSVQYIIDILIGERTLNNI